MLTRRLTAKWIVLHLVEPSVTQRGASILWPRECRLAQRSSRHHFHVEVCVWHTECFGEGRHIIHWHCKATASTPN